MWRKPSGAFGAALMQWRYTRWEGEGDQPMALCRAAAAAWSCSADEGQALPSAQWDVKSCVEEDFDLGMGEYNTLSRRHKLSALPVWGRSQKTRGRITCEGVGLILRQEER
jgi:hypothetical protein